MRHSYRPDIPPKPHSYRTQISDHLSLVAGMFEELGITEVVDQATQQDPEMRIVTAGHAVGQVVSDHMAQLHHTDRPTSLVADSALSNAENLHKLAETSLKWITRVPATLTEAQAGPPCGMSAISDIPHDSRVIE